MDNPEIIFNTELGRLLIAKRKSRKISQSGLAARIGVHRNTMMRWESGETAIPFWILLRVADVLCCNHLLLMPGREYVWPGAEAPPPPRTVPIPWRQEIQYERDPQLTPKERVQ